jgi:hypothetical protein
MFCEDAIIRRASSSTVWAWVSNRPAIARIECGSVIKRIAMLYLLVVPTCSVEEVLAVVIGAVVAAQRTDYG